mgnify:CR=1 FL=1
MNWLTPNIIISLVLAFVTTCYTIINYKMLKESKLIRKQKTKPDVIAYLQDTSDHQVSCLHIKNVGEGYARNVKINVIQDHHLFGKNKFLKDFPLFGKGVTIFPFGYDLHYSLDTWSNIINKDQSEGYIELDIYYEDMKGDTYHNSFKLPLMQIVNLYSIPPDNSIDQIPYYLKEINKTLQNMKKHTG